MFATPTPTRTQALWVGAGSWMTSVWCETTKALQDLFICTMDVCVTISHLTTYAQLPIPNALWQQDFSFYIAFVGFASFHYNIQLICVWICMHVCVGVSELVSSARAKSALINIVCSRVQVTTYNLHRRCRRLAPTICKLSLSLVHVNLCWLRANLADTHGEGGRKALPQQQPIALWLHACRWHG